MFLALPGNTGVFVVQIPLIFRQYHQVLKEIIGHLYKTRVRAYGKGSGSSCVSFRKRCCVGKMTGNAAYFWSVCCEEETEVRSTGIVRQEGYAAYAYKLAELHIRAL